MRNSNINFETFKGDVVENTEIFFELPAIKGMQAGRPYYVTMCPLHLVAKIFTFTDNSLPPEMRVQRVLNKQRIPEMRDYILNNRDNYVFSALTASVDGELLFESEGISNSVGQLRIPINSRIIINDGQHRRAAIEAVLEECPDLRHEDISIVLYYDLGLDRSQQMFTDLNRHAIRPTKSLNILYDNRDIFSIMIKECILKIPMFNGSVENEKTCISNRSKELFTLSGIFHASKLLFQKQYHVDTESQSIITAYWNAVASNMLIWQKAKDRVMTPDFFRQTYICAHAITLKALGEVGRVLISNCSDQSKWSDKLQFLQSINWNKESPDLQGLVIINGRIASSQINQKAFFEYILSKADWDFTSERID